MVDNETISKLLSLRFHSMDAEARRVLEANAAADPSGKLIASAAFYYVRSIENEDFDEDHLARTRDWLKQRIGQAAWGAVEIIDSLLVEQARPSALRSMSP